MQLIKSEKFNDILIFESAVYRDNRGYFTESYKTKVFEELGFDKEFVQDNHSWSHKNVIRGMHYQWDPPMGKLVRVITGAVYDVVVDVRSGSSTFGQSYGVLLSQHNNKQLWVPPGFAHGFLSLENNTHVVYKCSGLYNNLAEGGINPLENYLWEQYWNKWVPERSSLIVSEKDKEAQTFKEYSENPKFEK